MHKAFQSDPKFPHPEGTNKNFSLSFTSYDDWSLAVILSGCPLKGQITAHRVWPQSANVRESIKWWRCHHSNGYWGQLVPCHHQAALCKGHPKIKLQTQFLVFERFETLVRKESLFVLHDNRHWVTPHTFPSVRNKSGPWYSLCTGNIVRYQCKENQDDRLENPLGLFVSVFPSVQKGLHTADKLTTGLLTYHFLVGTSTTKKSLQSNISRETKAPASSTEH